MDKGNLSGKMAQNTKENGKMGNRMEKGYFTLPTNRIKKLKLKGCG